jgi:hypothetical protein
MRDRQERERRAEEERRDEAERIRIIHFDLERMALEKGRRKEPEEGPKNFMLGQNLPIDPVELAEREARRRVQEEHQQLLEKQVMQFH